MKRTYELPCYDRKSFYGKAIVILQRNHNASYQQFQNPFQHGKDFQKGMDGTGSRINKLNT